MTAVAHDATVMLVEDDRSLADLYAEWLGESYHVTVAYDGTAALEEIDETVDVVLLDRMMPGRSGSEVLAEIRAREIDCQVVMVSAVTPDLDIVQMGFDAYLEKPVDPSALHGIVAQMLTRARYDEKLQELFSLIERQDTLEAVKRPAVLETSTEYRELVEKLERVQREVESLLTDLSDDDFRVAVERLQRTAAERAGQRRYESLTDDVLDTSREAMIVVDSDGAVVWANEATESLLGFDRESSHGRPYSAVASAQFEGIETDAGPLVSLIETGLSSHVNDIEAVVHVPAETGQDERWLEYWSAPIDTGLYAGGRIEHYHDITGRYRREQYLQTLHSATRDLMAAETVDVIADRTVTTATADLEFPYAALFVRVAGTGNLVPQAMATEHESVDPSLPTLSGGTGPVWTAFVESADEIIAADGWERTGDDDWLDDAFEDWMLCPLGRQGVFLAATPTAPALTDTQQSLAKTWAANARQALERVARTRDLRERDRELKRQNERLSRLDRINRLIRSIAPAVVDADTREAVESEVCRRLLRLDPVTGAWIADVDPATESLVCRARDGDFHGYLDGVPSATQPDQEALPAATPAVPARRAFDRERPVVVTDLVDVEPGPWWRDRGLAGGTHAIVAIPIVRKNSRFGSLEVHIDRPQGLSDEEVDALEELVVTVGHAIASIRQRDALLSGGATELTFRIGAASALSRLADAVAAPFSVIDVSQQSDGTCVVFVALSSTSDHDREVLVERIRTMPDASVLRNDEAQLTCVVTLGADSPIRAFIEYGATLQRIEFHTDSQELTVAVGLSHLVDIREYVDAVATSIEDVELIAKYDQPVDEPGADSRVGREGRLTEKQRETIQTAFHAGYFDWPRSADAETVAGELGIAQSTFSQHLRAAEHKLLEDLFT
ncbi:response regulator [Halobellus sp. Atlit-31R]|nr:response regulator [Halobellus sp. Atlit-31R]